MLPTTDKSTEGKMTKFAIAPYVAVLRQTPEDLHSPVLGLEAYKSL